MTSRTADCGAKGFTLSEVMLAVAVLSTAILALIGVFMGGLKLSNSSKSLATATEVAAETLENIKLLGHSVASAAAPAVFDGRNPDGCAGAFPPAPYPLKTVDGNDYWIKVEVAPHTVPSTVRARVEVFHREEGRVVLETLLHP